MKGQWSIGLLVVVLLLAANLLLIPLAFENAQGPSVDAGDRAATTEDVPRPTRRASSVDQQSAVAASLLMASGGELIVSSTRGSCDGGPDPFLRLSDDRGKSFRTVDIDSEVTAVLAIEVIDDEQVLLLAADEACRTVGYESRDKGRSWKSVDPTGRWHLDGWADAKRVYSPRGPMTTPCAPRAMSIVRNDIVRLLCPDGRILRSPDDRSWTVIGQLEGAVALRFPIPEVGFSLARQRNCDAAVMRTTDSGTTWERIACLEGDRPRGISGQDGLYAAAVDDTVQVSDDRAETWQSP